MKTKIIYDFTESQKNLIRDYYVYAENNNIDVTSVIGAISTSDNQVTNRSISQSDVNAIVEDELNYAEQLTAPTEPLSGLVHPILVGRDLSGLCTGVECHGADKLKRYQYEN